MMAGRGVWMIASLGATVGESEDIIAGRIVGTMAGEFELKAVPPVGQTLRCRTVAAGGFRQQNFVRNLPPFAVEERFGRPDEASSASPSETLLAALGSCLSAHIHANAALGNIVIDSLEVDLEVDVAKSPMWDPPGAAPWAIGFEAVRVVVHIQANASTEAIDALVTHAVLWSPVANTIHDPVHLEVTVSRMRNNE
jgi:uncharacterized OsmC-like protein